MIDSGPSFSELGLTKVEMHQTERRVSSPDDERMRIGFFKQNPEVRKNVVAEPFTDTTRERVRQVSASDNAYAILRSAILSEPDGAYEQTFGKLSRNEKLQKLYDQTDSSAEMTIRIQRYIESNLPNLDNVSDGELYKILCQTAFGSEDESVIQAKYSLSQRRGFRLSIANFLETRGKLAPYRLESSVDPKAFAEKYLRSKFTGNIAIEQLPIGLVIYLDEQDYALIESYDKSTKSISSKGVTLSSVWLPQELQGKIILLDRGGKEIGVKTAEELIGTRGHEIRHIVFQEFHAQSETYMSDTREALAKCKTEQEYQKVSGAIYENFVEKAKDEIIAYFSQGRFDESYSGLKFDQYRWHMEEAEEALSKRSDMPEETKRAILKTFTNNRRKCFETIRGIRFIAESMYKQPNNRFMQKMLVRLGLKKDNTSYQNDISEALLRNAPGTKINRLAKYTGLTINEIDRIIKEKDQQAIDKLNKLLTVPKYYDENWWNQALQTRDQIKKQLPIDTLPILLNAVSKWSEQGWTSLWTEEAILLTKDYIRVHGVADADRQKITQAMNGVITQKSGIKDFEESVKFAQETLDLFR